MSTLKSIEKKQLEELLRMSSGFVLEFSNRTFQEFFYEAAHIDIYSDKYAFNGESKAKRLRAFWEIEPDKITGKVLAELMEHWRYENQQPNDRDVALAERCNRIIERLLGKQVKPEDDAKRFLAEELGDFSLKEAAKDPALLTVLESRLEEATRCLQAEAPLAVIFMCGSLLEGLLLDVATANPRQFNEAPNSPKDKSGKVKALYDWKLAELIDVACEVGCLTLDVKKFSHAVRDFRNYIHPRAQMASRFSPTKHTAEICLKVLKAAIAALSSKKV